MSNPKIRACPHCGQDGWLTVYAYDSGWRYVECDAPGCWYSGPGEGSVRQAIKSHNARALAKAEGARS